MGEVDRGERVAAVARRHRVQPRTLTWWRWKLGSEAPAPAARPRFLPVVVSQSSSPPTTTTERVQVRVGDVTIRFARETDVAYVAALVSALRT